MTIAYKFLRPGRMAPFTGARWPPAGEWLDGGGSPALCRCGIHALEAVALPKWMTEELWRVELDDSTHPGGGIVLARRGRLVERVAGWSDETAHAYAEDCLHHLPRGGCEVVRTRAADTVAVAATVIAGTAAAEVGYCAAKAAEADAPGGYERERIRQAIWLASRLELERSTPG